MLVCLPLVLRAQCHYAYGDRDGIKKELTTSSMFTVPLGATINMDGTAIMQGSNGVIVTYGVDLGINDYLFEILTATLALLAQLVTVLGH